MGYWPAFWLLPADGANMGCSGCGRHGVWAASGEIDVMELANDMKSLQVGDTSWLLVVRTWAPLTANFCCWCPPNLTPTQPARTLSLPV